VSILRAAIAVGAVSLAGCDSLVGLQDITPDGAPVALSLASPSKGLAQQPLGLIQVDVLDIRNHPVMGFTGQITLALGNNPSGATLLGTVSTAAAGGTATFDLVGIDKLGTGYTLTASTDGVPSATSGPIDIVLPAFTPVATGVAGGPIAGVAISPAPAGGAATIFAGAGDGVYKSVDGGANWKLASFGADITGRLVADPSRPGVVYEGRAGSTNSYFLKKTVDGGASWHNLAQGDRQFGFQYVYSFALDPANPSVIYTAGQTPARSSDGGTTWTRLGIQSACNQIAVDQATSDTVYCIGYTTMTGLTVGLYKSTNGGAAWASANNGITMPTTVSNLFTTPKGVFVYADNKVYRSIDAGASWTGTSLLYPNAMAYAPSMPNRVYLANGGAISVSNDGGANFTAAGSGVADSFQSLAVDPTNPDIVYAAGNAGGVYVSRNGGVNWAASSKGIDAHLIRSVAMVPGTPGTALIAISGTVLRTTNGGGSWAAVTPPAPQVDVNVHADPHTNGRVYLCGFTYFATSTNGGASFTGGSVPTLTGGPCNRLLVVGTTMFAAAGGLYKSTDSGATWANTGVGTNLYVADVALGDASGNVVVAATQMGTYRSTNGGASFTQVTNGYTSAIVSDPRTPANIIIPSDVGCGYRVSTDGGATYAPAITGPCMRAMNGVGSTLYFVGTVANNALAMLTSTDGGMHWASIDVSGAPNGVNVSSIAASDDGATVYLGTFAGLYKGPGH
jgi:photosystem II stability/assembly factor-like uncharacterized protein